jgi:nicotinamide-nucleotide amidase
MSAATTIAALAQAVGSALHAQGLVLTTAESCTAGGVAYAITGVPGSSQWFEHGFVVYANHAKEQMLGVAPRILRRDGAVSEAVARALALGALRVARAQVAVAISGIAGPQGGSARKPVGTVCFAWALQRAVATPPWVRSQTAHFAGDRAAVRTQSIVAALAGVVDILAQPAQEPQRSEA